MTQMSHAEQMDIITKALTAAQAGDHQEELRLARQFPLWRKVSGRMGFIRSRGGIWKRLA